MKRAYFVVMLFSLIYVQLLQAKQLTQQEKQNSAFSTYIKDLEELGYCVIPNVFSREETKLLYERVWEEFIEKAWPDCRKEDRSNWKDTFPMHNKEGTFAGPAGQTQVMWDVRQDPRTVKVFSTIWNTDELLVSMDGLGIMCPPEIRQGYIEPWMHVDQGFLHRQDGEIHSNHSQEDFESESCLKTNPYTIQGQFLFEDSFAGDGGFYCIPKSHLRFQEFAPQLDVINTKLQKSSLRREARTEFLQSFFSIRKDSSGSPYQMQHISAPAGSLILWDSRTVHWNQYASRKRPREELPKVRMVGYICYVPKKRLTKKAKVLRKLAWESGVGTGHNPTCPELKRTKDYIWKEYAKYLENDHYHPPKVKLTPLGKSLLGIYE